MATENTTPDPGSSSLELPPIAEVPPNLPAYKRGDWGGWRDADGDCQDTRHEVLIAESQVPVTFKTSKGCQVATGQWWAAFTNTTVFSASDLQIDHFVALKNAHDSGGWAWDTATKRKYANDLTNPQHLIAVTGRANQSKGARGPDQWKPENMAYWCTYATDWVGVKTIWGLTVTSAEAEALTTMLETCGTAVTVTQSQAPAPAPTPTPTATAAPMAAPAPTATATPSSEPEASARFEIVDLNCGAKGANLEYITIRNNGSQTGNLDGWSLHDEGSNHSYPFASGVLLNPGGEISVWSGTSDAKAKTLYWQSKGVWNNSGDTAFLLNPSGALVSQRACA